MELLSLVLRIILVAAALALVALSVGTLSRRGMIRGQQARFLFVTGVSVIGALRGAELFSLDALPLWELVVADVVFLIGIYGSASFFWEVPAARPPIARGKDDTDPTVMDP